MKERWKQNSEGKNSKNEKGNGGIERERRNTHKNGEAWEKCKYEEGEGGKERRRGGTEIRIEGRSKLKAMERKMEGKGR